eukprot:TRINITY_DN297_c0_g1_i4.p2 TRINITY_DN297_c0_g1~~TRINITY_DN297_c0_g1_i4.p2  ORF type:complete len:298 (+),score=53.85 TRINITY_DN297_c0_g1_i4:61-954(+)
MDVYIVLPTGDNVLQSIDCNTKGKQLKESVADELSLNVDHMELLYEETLIQDGTILVSMGVSPGDQIILQPCVAGILKEILSRLPVVFRDSDWTGATANDEKFAEHAVSQNADNYVKISDRLKHDLAFNRRLVKDTRIAREIYRYMSEAIRGDKVVAMKALKYCKGNWNIVPRKLKKNTTFQKFVVRKVCTPFGLKDFPMNTTTVTAYLKSMNNTTSEIQQYLLNDHEAVVNSCSAYPKVLSLFSHEICKDPDVKSLAIRCLVRSPRCWNFVPNNLKNDETFIDEVVSAGGDPTGFI